MSNREGNLERAGGQQDQSFKTMGKRRNWFRPLFFKYHNFGTHKIYKRTA